MGSILDLGFLWMSCLVYLPCLYRVNRKEVAWNIVFNSNVGRMFHLFEMLVASSLDEVEIVSRILSLRLGRLEVKRIFWTVKLIVVIDRQVVV